MCYYIIGESMNSRMERYKEINSDNFGSRVSKNQDLYSDINNQALSRIKSNPNYKVIGDSEKEIDIEKIKKYLNLSDEEEVRKRINIEPKSLEEIKEDFLEPKVYDLNSIIEEAKSKKESKYEEDKYRKLHSAQYDILQKIKSYDSNKEEKNEVELNTEEQTLVDLINTIAMKKNEGELFSELMSENENTVVTKPIEEELKGTAIIKQIEEPQLDNTKTNLKSIDKSFYTNSMNFSKEDFEGLEDLEKEVNKNNIFVKFALFIFVVVVVISILIIINYVADLGLF